MRESLESWVADAGTLRYSDHFELGTRPLSVNYLMGREGDFFLALVGELFDRLRHPYVDASDWSLLGNAFAEFGFFREGEEDTPLPRDTALFSATAFYLGGFSASAYLTLAAADRAGSTEGHIAAYELLARPHDLTSARVRDLLRAVRIGDREAISAERLRADELAAGALDVGPEEWVGWRLYQEMLRRFVETNIRNVLPDEPDGFWDPLIASLLRRTPPVWDFFPSQVSAIRAGLTNTDSTFSLQMPTGAGKTALTETVIFSHLSRHPSDVAILLVPYRALAAELRGTLVRRLNAMEINSRSLYGGTVPTGDEIHALDDVRALVATPESLSGLLSADPAFFRRISLVVCDEGHLLDGQARGVGLELLLARMRALDTGAPRFVFVSAIVPNIEEINAWLGGTDETVVRSEYRPALAEFARLDSSGSGGERTITLRFHPHEAATFDIEGFLTRDDFRYLNVRTGRQNTYPFDTIKTQAVATARKALQMGTVAVFAANKRGNQGCIGLAAEILSQLAVPTALPKPVQFVRDQAALQAAVDYLTLEYGSEWIGTRTLRAGAVVHHGDIPQETREVLEKLVRQRVVRLAFCTSTLAEGVNLPIRTLVLYSVQRRLPSGRPENLLARDIRNLVGRAGRAGSTTKGLVICANSQQWTTIEPVARQVPGEPVRGALLSLMQRVQAALTRRGLVLTNELLERSPALYTLIDGVDATLIDLATEELGEDELVRIAGELTTQTYAAREASPETTVLMREVFELRAQRIVGIRGAGRLGWIRETGARARMLDSVESGLLPARERWDDITDPNDETLLDAVLEWAWQLPDVARAVSEAYRVEDADKASFQSFVKLWLDGRPLGEIASSVGVPVDDALAIYSRVIAYELQTVVEQGVALLRRFCEAENRGVSSAVVQFPEHLRFGVPNNASRFLAAAVRHRRAAVALGRSAELAGAGPDDRDVVLAVAAQLIDDTEGWLRALGRLVLTETIQDLRRYSPGPGRVDEP